MSKATKLPKSLHIAYDGNREDLLDDMMEKAFIAAEAEVTEKLDKVSGLEERLKEAYPDEQIDAEEWLSHQISLLLYAYMSHRTGIIVQGDEEDQIEQPEELLSDALSETAEILGSKATQEIFATLTLHTDSVIEEKFGKQIAS